MGTEVRRLLNSSGFRERHRVAHDRWAEAESRLWGAESTKQLTDIGHVCREAIQQFISDLVEKHQLDGVEQDSQKTVSRLRAIIDEENVSGRSGAVQAGKRSLGGRVIVGVSGGS